MTPAGNVAGCSGEKAFGGPGWEKQG